MASEQFEIINGSPDMIICNYCNVAIEKNPENNYSEHLNHNAHIAAQNGRQPNWIKSNILQLNGSEFFLAIHHKSEQGAGKILCRVCDSKFDNFLSKAKIHCNTKSHQFKTGQSVSEIDKLIAENEGAIDLSTNDPRKIICYVCDTQFQITRLNHLKNHLKGVLHSGIMKASEKSDKPIGLNSIWEIKRYNYKHQKLLLFADNCEFIKIIEVNSQEKLCCTICNQTFDATRRAARYHLDSVFHLGNIPDENGVSENNFLEELYVAFAAADIPVTKLDRFPVLKSFIEKHTKRKIPKADTLKRRYLELSYQKSIESIRNNLGDDSIQIVYDETCDKKHRRIANLYVRSLTNPDVGPYLLHMKELSKVDSQSMIQFVNEGLHLLYMNEFHQWKDRVLISLTDSAAYMIRANRELRYNHGYHNMISIQCTSHKLHNIADEIRKSPTYQMINKLVIGVKEYFKNSSLRREKYKTDNPGILAAPDPIITRWATWILAVIYYACIANREAISKTLRGHLISWNFVSNSEENNNEAQQFRPIEEICAMPEVQKQAEDIQRKFKFMADTIKLVQSHKIKATRKIEIYNGTIQSLSETENPPAIAKKTAKKPDFKTYVLNKYSENEGLITLENFLLRGEITNQIIYMNMDERRALNNADITSVDSERGFSIQNAFFRPNRRCMDFNTMHKLLVTNEFRKKIKGEGSTARVILPVVQQNTEDFEELYENLPDDTDLVFD